MHRRRPLLLALPAGLLAPLAHSAWAALPRFTISREQIEAAVAERFPVRYPVAGLVELAVQAPRIALRPERNRLNAAMDVEAGGPALRRRYAGLLDVDFGLRYEASDRTLRATDLQVNQLAFPDLRPDAAALLSQAAPQLAREALREVVLHTLRPQDLAVPDGLGLQPGAITVTARGLAVELVQKPASP